jgi:hypothetical protein
MSIIFSSQVQTEKGNLITNTRKTVIAYHFLMHFATIVNYTFEFTNYIGK